MITGPEAGITRDSIAIDWEWTDKDGNVRPVRLIDTAGMRRKARVQDKLEKLRSEEHTSELQSLMRISYAVFCLKKKKKKSKKTETRHSPIRSYRQNTHA